jgi:hypothetical protein
MDMAHETVLFHEPFVGGRSIGRARPHAARGVGLVEQPFAQKPAFIGGGIRRTPFANEAKAAIDRDVVLIPKERDRQINGWR